MSDVGRKVVSDKGRLNRERQVTKASEFPSCAGKSFFFPPLELEPRIRDGVDVRDRMTGMVEGYHQRNEKQRWLS